MSKYIGSYSLLALCCWITLGAGCFPEDSLDWSDDGSLGLLRNDQGLYLVDGDTGDRTTVCEGEIVLWPHLSKDCTRIVYADTANCSSLSEGLQALSAAQLAMLENDAKQLRDIILSESFTADQFQWDKEHLLGYEEPYRLWLARYVCERSEASVTEKLGADLISQGKATELLLNQLIVVSRDKLGQGRVIATDILLFVRPRFSPDGRYIAYIVPDPHDTEAETGSLHVIATEGDGAATEVRSGVALCYDWRPDGRALAYMKQDGDALLGVLEEQTILDEAGTLKTQLEADAATAPVGVYRCTGENKQLAGTLFQPFMKVQYGPSGRLFFSSPAARIPTSDLEEPTYSLFCYDFLTGTVVDVLPASISALVDDMVNFFVLSPDGTKVLLPLQKHRFAIYTLGEKPPVLPIDEAEEFGEDVPDMLPAWKGNSQLSCLVSNGSHFLGNRTGQDERHEIVVLNADGNLQNHLSKDWPTEMIP